MTKNMTRNEHIIKEISELFYYGDSGGRPRALEEAEYEMNCKIWSGMNLLNKYLLESNDYSCFHLLHSKIDIFHLQKIFENCIDKGYKIDTVAKWLSQSIAQCLDFYTQWSEKNPNSFIEYLSETFVHNLLELYEDDRFFMLLTSISKVRNEKALSLLSYYADDEEIHIRTKIRELINTMR